MTAKLAPPPIASLIDGSGNPLSGGKLYTLIAGGSITDLKATFTDQEATTEHANPIILNSRGEPDTGGGIFWASGLYKVVLKTSADVTVWTEDDFDAQVTDDAGPTVNLIPNGSFETDTDGDSNPDNWTLSDATLATIIRAVDQQKHGAASLKGISTGAGSGYATSAAFVAIDDRNDLEVSFEGRVSVNTLNMRVRVYWYDEDEVALGTPSTDAFSGTLTAADTWYEKRVRVTPPAGARLCKTECYPVTNAITGNAWIDNLIVTQAVNSQVKAVTATVTLTGADEGLVTVDSSAGAVIITLPPAADVAGMAFAFVAIDLTNTITIQRAGSDTINGATSFTLAGKYEAMTLVSDGSSVWHRETDSGGHVRTLTADATLGDDEWGLFILDGNAATVTVTLPAAANADGKPRTFVAIDISNALTIQRAGSDTINGATSVTLDAVYDERTLRSDGSALWYDTRFVVAANSIGQTEIGGAAVGRAELKTTAVTSLAGTVNNGADLDITLTHYAFFPMIHAQTNDLFIVGHVTDGASADAPRFALNNTSGSGKTYDIDYRYVAA